MGANIAPWTARQSRPIDADACGAPPSRRGASCGLVEPPVVAGRRMPLTIVFVDDARHRDRLRRRPSRSTAARQSPSTRRERCPGLTTTSPAAAIHTPSASESGVRRCRMRAGPLTVIGRLLGGEQRRTIDEVLRVLLAHLGLDVVGEAEVIGPAGSEDATGRWPNCSALITRPGTILSSQMPRHSTPLEDAVRQRHRGRERDHVAREQRTAPCPRRPG